MKKTLMAALLIAMAMLLSATALAAGQTNPRRAEMEKALNYRVPRATGYSMSLTQVQKPTLSQPGIWRVAITGDISDGYRITFGISDLDRDPTGYVYFPAPAQTKKITTCEFVTAGNYELTAFLSVPNAEGYVASDYLRFTVADDSDHETLEEIAAKIVKECKASDEWHTALNLHDWITRHAYYDNTLEYYGADGVLMRGYGVCDSYSKAYELLLRTAGIDSERVFGGNHAWNAVNLEGQWTQIDTTWDDPNDGSAVPVSSYENRLYFGLNDELMYLDHVNNGNGFTGSCTTLDENYYVHEGYWRDFTYSTTDGYTYIDTIEAMLGLGLTSFFAQHDDILVIGETGSYYDMSSMNIEFMIYLSAAAYGMNSLDWTDAEGTPLDLYVYYDFEENGFAVEIYGFKIDETGVLRTPSSLTKLDVEALAGVPATTVMLNDGCKSIGARAFFGSGVRKIFIPASVTSIASDAFQGCESIFFYAPEGSAAERFARANSYLCRNWG